MSQDISEIQQLLLINYINLANVDKVKEILDNDFSSLLQQQSSFSKNISIDWFSDLEKYVYLQLPKNILHIVLSAKYKYNDFLKLLSERLISLFSSIDMEDHNNTINFLDKTLHSVSKKIETRMNQILIYVLKKLIENNQEKSYVNYSDNGVTPLMLASDRRDKITEEILIKAGADTRNIRTYFNYDPDSLDVLLEIEENEQKIADKDLEDVVEYLDRYDEEDGNKLKTLIVNWKSDVRISSTVELEDLIENERVEERNRTRIYISKSKRSKKSMPMFIRRQILQKEFVDGEGFMFKSRSKRSKKVKSRSKRSKKTKSRSKRSKKVKSRSKRTEKIKRV